MIADQQTANHRGHRKNVTCAGIIKSSSLRPRQERDLRASAVLSGAHRGTNALFGVFVRAVRGTGAREYRGVGVQQCDAQIGAVVSHADIT